MLEDNVKEKTSPYLPMMHDKEIEEVIVLQYRYIFSTIDEGVSRKYITEMSNTVKAMSCNQLKEKNNNTLDIAAFSQYIVI